MTIDLDKARGVMGKSALLIDWLSLRIPLSPVLGAALLERIQQSINKLYCVDSAGEIVWEKRALDVDALRSDTVGLCWMVQNDGHQEYLSIGASPASLEHGINVFGELDIRRCAKTLIAHACKALKAVLPPLQHWQCTRIDITGNYVLPDAASVKQALRQLALADGGRRKATNKTRGGDSVYWNPTSDLVKGKAYHKGPQLAMLVRKGKIECPKDKIDMADRLLRLEHTRSSRWFRELRKFDKNWFELTTTELEKYYYDFFTRIVDGIEVTEMEREDFVKRIQAENAISESRAMGAFTTYRNIRQDGFEVVKAYMPKSTFYLHLKYLRAAGVSDADLQMGNVVQFRPVRIILAKPVTCWEDIRRAA